MLVNIDFQSDRLQYLQKCRNGILRRLDIWSTVPRPLCPSCCCCAAEEKRKNWKRGWKQRWFSPDARDFRPLLSEEKTRLFLCVPVCVCARVYVFDFKTRLAISVLPCGSCNYSKYSREQRVKACEKRRENRSLSLPLSLSFLLIFRRLRLAFCCCAAFVCMCVSCVRVRMYV